MHDLVRPVQTPAEVALFVHLLPDFSKTTKVDYSHMAIEYNNRIMQAFLAGKPLDAYPKNGRELGKFADSYVKKIRERDSLSMLGFSQALTLISPPQPLIFLPSLNPNLDQPGLYGNQQPAVSQWPTGIIQQPAAADPKQTSGPPQPQFAPMFQPPAAAGAAASTKRVRDETVGKASNQGTGNGGKGVSKRCRACSRMDPSRVRVFCLPTCTSEPAYGARQY